MSCFVFRLGLIPGQIGCYQMIAKQYNPRNFQSYLFDTTSVPKSILTLNKVLLSGRVCYRHDKIPL